MLIVNDDKLQVEIIVTSVFHQAVQTDYYLQTMVNSIRRMIEITNSN